MTERIALKKAACPAVFRPVERQGQKAFGSYIQRCIYLLAWHTSSTRVAKRASMHLTHVFHVLLSFSPFDSQSGTLR